MSTDYEEHLSSILKNDVARSNRFKVTFNLPSGITSGTTSSNSTTTSTLTKAITSIAKIISAYSGATVKQLSFNCDQTEIPGRNLVTSEATYNGDTIKTVYGSTYGIHPFTFHCSKDLYEKVIIDKWQELAYNPLSHTSAYLDEYTTDIRIDALNRADEVEYSVILKNAYPVNCNALTYANSEENNMVPLMVTFNYKRWIRPDQDTTGNGLLTSLSQTPLGPYVTEYLSNPVVQEATNWLKDSTGLDLEGEAMNIYNMLDGIVKNTTGSSITKSTTLINSMITSINSNSKITDAQKAVLLKAARESISILGKG